jgi:hypothetical protein
MSRIINQHCQHKINEVSECPYVAKIEVTTFDEPTVSRFFCFSHLMSFIKYSRGKFIIQRMEIK